MLYPPPQVQQEAIATNALWDQLDEGLVRVEVENRRYALPESLIEAVQQAPNAHGVALIPPNDPYLRQVDRSLLVPERTRRHAVYRSLSGPGALLVDGEVAGTWRYRRAEREVNIEPFWTLRAVQRTAAEQSASRVATSTGDPAPSVSWS